MEWFAKAIQDNLRLKEGDTLPSERSLVIELGWPRQFIRECINIFEWEGFLSIENRVQRKILKDPKLIIRTHPTTKP